MDSMNRIGKSCSANAAVRGGWMPRCIGFYFAALREIDPLFWGLFLAIVVQAAVLLTLIAWRWTW